MGLLLLSGMANGAPQSKESEQPSMALLQFLAELEEVNGKLISPMDMKAVDAKTKLTPVKTDKTDSKTKTSSETTSSKKTKDGAKERLNKLNQQEEQ